MKKTKKSHLTLFQSKLFKKLVILGIIIFLIGGIYQLLRYGTGPFAPILTHKNTINLINGLDPEEAAFLQKTINSTTTDVKTINVVTKNPVNAKNESANLVITKVPPPSDGLEAEEAAFLQKSLVTDKAAKGSTGITAANPTLKVTVINPVTKAEETSLIKLNSENKVDLKTLTANIRQQVSDVNNYNRYLSKDKAFCYYGNQALANGEQIYLDNGRCGTCTINFTNKYSYTNQIVTDIECSSYVGNNKPYCVIYQPSSNTISNQDLSYTTQPDNQHNTIRKIPAHPKRQFHAKINGKNTIFKCINNNDVGQFIKIR